MRDPGGEDSTRALRNVTPPQSTFLNRERPLRASAVVLRRLGWSKVYTVADVSLVVLGYFGSPLSTPSRTQRRIALRYSQVRVLIVTDGEEDK